MTEKFTICILVLIAACGSETKDVTTLVEEKVEKVAPARKRLGVASPGTDVTALSIECEAGADEACNALDDDCDGRIDEGCGYSSGSLQVTMAWNTGADIDLSVVDPSGETLSHQRPEGHAGGKIDHVGRGDCEKGVEPARVENYVWKKVPPAGTYRVEALYWGECNTGAGPTTVSLSMSIGGKTFGAYNATLSPNQHVTLATFNVR